MARKEKTTRTQDALELMDRRYGVSSDADALHERFTAQAEVAETLFSARKAAGLTQAQLAELAGTTQQLISQLEDADYEGHSLSMLRRIAAAMDSHIELRIMRNEPKQVVS